MPKAIRDNSLTIVLITLFAIFLAGQFVTGLRVYNEERESREMPAVSTSDYLTSGHFVEATFENWESEFLQMGFYVLFTAFLFQRGSAESRDPDETGEPDPPKPLADSPWPVKRGGIVLTLYAHSLTIAMLLFFAAALFMHAWGGARVFSEERIAEGESAVSIRDFVTTSDFWFQSFQNWQSEFLAVASLVLLSIVLRQRNSPESKLVEAPHRQTGT